MAGAKQRPRAKEKPGMPHRTQAPSNTPWRLEIFGDGPDFFFFWLMCVLAGGGNSLFGMGSLRWFLFDVRALLNGYTVFVLLICWEVLQQILGCEPLCVFVFDG